MGSEVVVVGGVVGRYRALLGVVVSERSDGWVTCLCGVMSGREGITGDYLMVTGCFIQEAQRACSRTNLQKKWRNVGGRNAGGARCSEWCGARAGGGRKRGVGRSEDGGMEGVVRCMRQGAARAGSAGVRAYGRARWADYGDYGTTASAVNQSCCPEIVRRIVEQPCDPPTIPYDPPATLTPLPPLRPYGLRLAHSPDAPPWGGGAALKAGTAP